MAKCLHKMAEVERQLQKAQKGKEEAGGRAEELQRELRDLETALQSHQEEIDALNEQLAEVHVQVYMYIHVHPPSCCQMYRDSLWRWS